MPPVPPKPWTDVKNVTHDTTSCAQWKNPKPGESEDCLYLDVTTPHDVTNSSTPLPVMMFIHGGGFRHGSKNGGDGRPLASHNVIVVSVNYRLGPLGFLSTGDSSIPGNFGMLDQISAMKWVQANIAAFGGDPSRVTIFGTSAGGSAVSMHILSPLSKGLFARAIMESSVASTSREVPPPMLPTTLKEVSLGVGHLLGCGQTPGVAFRACLQKQSLRDFFNATGIAERTDHSSGPWRPTIETVFGFMPDYPLRLRHRGEFAHDVDTIRGFCSQEQGGAVRDSDNDGLTREEFRRAAALQLRDFPYLNSSKYVGLLEQVYLENVTDPFEIRSRTIQMRSDYTYILPIVTEVQHAKRRNHANSNTFMYNFNYRASFTKQPAWQGVTHTKEKQFVWGIRLDNSTTATDRAVSSALQVSIEVLPQGKAHFEKENRVEARCLHSSSLTHPVEFTTNMLCLHVLIMPMCILYYHCMSCCLTCTH